MKILRSATAGMLLSMLALAASASGKVDINTADAPTLARVLSNVGISKAEEIVAHRDANGPFRSADELARVKGIGLATIERNRDRIEVGGAPRGGGAAAAAAPGASPSQRR